MAFPAVYKINDANYFQLRDVAALLDGTSAQFSIVYSEENGIEITTGEAYTMLGHELKTTATESKETTFSGDNIMINGVKVNLDAFKIDGANYFQIRGLANALGFTVGYDEATSSISIDTK